MGAMFAWPRLWIQGAGACREISLNLINVVPTIVGVVQEISDIVVIL